MAFAALDEEELPELSSTAECKICADTGNEFRMLECGHQFCVFCIRKFRESESPSCPYCRRPVLYPANHYPIVVQQDGEPEDFSRGQDFCQMDNCSRHIEHYCTTCKHFICYRCRKRTKCGGVSSHSVVDVDELQPLAREMFPDWEKSKQNVIKDLRSEISQLLSKLKDVGESLSRESRQETVQNARRLYALAVQVASEHATLEHYKDIGQATESQLIKLIQLMTYKEDRFPVQEKDVKEIKDGKAKNAVKDISNKNVEKNLFDEDENIMAESQPKIFPTAMGFHDKFVERSSSKDQTDDIELHHNQLCRYNCSPVVRGSSTAFTWTRKCCCGHFPEARENHSSRACKWRRIIDQATKKVYLHRRCNCGDFYHLTSD
ncbi:tripartite motif-containing protein 5-like [Watersipora subatra]|uniref:tripartite motif-containing protein 5-like n=1 Tax=Watersipora subatra TaxID=2589382 RepID=UPI00355B08AB